MALTRVELALAKSMNWEPEFMLKCIEGPARPEYVDMVAAAVPVTIRKANAMYGMAAVSQAIKDGRVTYCPDMDTLE